MFLKNNIFLISRLSGEFCFMKSHYIQIYIFILENIMKYFITLKVYFMLFKNIFKWNISIL